MAQPKGMGMNEVGAVILGAIVLRALAQLGLGWLNGREVCRHAEQMPEALAGVVDPVTYRRAVDYTLARNRLDQVEVLVETAVVVGMLYSGVLPWWVGTVERVLGASAWAQALMVFGALLLLFMAGWPLQWYRQFRLEQAFGFNTMTPRLWMMDRLKGVVLSAVLGLPCLVLLLQVAGWAGASWWFYGWLVVAGYQLLLMGLGPALILRWFNRFTPLPEGPLRERLLALGERTGFPLRQIVVMDGSKRSRHANAFFAGAGRWRKVVLFDTLIQQLTEPEMEAVLAHEIGHYRRGHLLKLLALNLAGTLAGFAAVGWLMRQEAVWAAFGLPAGSLASALLLVFLAGGAVTFWLTPLWNLCSRRFEYEADAFAVRTLGSASPFISALRRLQRENLSNFTPHPWYSTFYYSHPTWWEREAALRRSEEAAGGAAAG